MNRKRSAWMAGGYFRRFSDQRIAEDSGFSEAPWRLRPTIYFASTSTRHPELSYQLRRPTTVDQDSGRYPKAVVARANGSHRCTARSWHLFRPFLYGIYTLSWLSSDAQYYLFEPQDVRAGHSLVHYLGLGVEWWFNSSYR